MSQQPVPTTADADGVFRMAMDWLRHNYDQRAFFAERDLVWTVQTKLIDLITQQRLPLSVFNDHRVELRGRLVYCDLVFILEERVALGVEFKYEPSHDRSGRDIPARKFPLCDWGKHGIGGDVAKVRALVEAGTMPVAHAILVDEGRYWRGREPHDGAHWMDWDNETDGSSPALHWFTARSVNDRTAPVR